MLRSFIDSLTEEAIIAQAQAARSSSRGVETALSLMVLRQSGRFAGELVSALSDPNAALGPSTVHPHAFDAVVFETAVLLHYSMLASYLRETTDDEYDGLSDELLSNASFIVLRGAYHATGEALNGRTAFSFSPVVYNSIAFSYAATSQGGGFVQRFESLLLPALEFGVPASASKHRSSGVSLSIDGMTVAMRARAFALSQIPAFAQVSDTTIRHARQLGFAY